MKKATIGKTTFGLDENVAALLCYALGWISGLVFFLAEKKNKTIRFHAMQSIVTFGVLQVIGWVLMFLMPVVGVIELILWVFLMVKAYKGEKYKLPFIGDFAEKQA